jgi:hypothetical protein
VNRETIYNALLAYLATLPSMPFGSTSRVWRPFTDYAAAQLPALCLDENVEQVANPEFAMPNVETLYVDAWLYFKAPQMSQVPGKETVIPQKAMNDALDSFTNTLTPTGGAYPNLGGLVEWLRIDGKIQKIAGVGNGDAQFCIAKVPITMRYAGPV